MQLLIFLPWLIEHADVALHATIGAAALFAVRQLLAAIKGKAPPEL